MEEENHLFFDIQIKKKRYLTRQTSYFNFYLKMSATSMSIENDASNPVSLRLHSVTIVWLVLLPFGM